MKKILEVVNGMNMGGIENFVMTILKNINKTDYKLDFLYTLDQDTYFDKEILSYHCNIYRVKGRSEGLMNHIRTLNEFFKYHHNYDAVHIHYAFSSCFTVAAFAKKYGIKNIIIHSHNTNAPHKIIHYICRPLLSIFGTQFCACSQLAAQWMFTSRTAKKTQIIHNAINDEKFIFNQKNRDEKRKELGVEDKFVVGCIGRLAEQKNHDFLLKIIKELIQINNNCILLLIGDGPLYESINSQIQAANLIKHVMMLGIRNDIPHLLSAMDVFVLPSLFEGLGIVYIEAQCNGLTCFGSEIVVPIDAKVSDLMYYLPLEDNPKQWAQVIANTRLAEDRIKYADSAKKHCYAIETEIRKIEHLYNRK